MKIKTSKSLILYRARSFFLLLLLSSIFVSLTNIIYIGTAERFYGVAGHSIFTALALSIYTYIYFRSVVHKYTFLGLYLLCSIPAYFLSTAVLYAGRSDKVQNRIITDGNASAILIAISLTILSSCIFNIKNRLLRYCLICIANILWFAVLAQFVIVVFYALRYGSGPTGPTIFAIIQTNFFEAYEYVLSQGGLVFSLLIVIFLLIPVLFYFLNKLFVKLSAMPEDSLFKGCGQDFSFIKAFALGFVSIFVLCNLNLANVYNSYRSAFITYSLQDEFKNSIDERKEILKSLNLETNSIKEGLYVVVIGESLTRDHMSAYGYARETTPWLSSIKGKDNFFLFKNAYSSHVISAFALSMVLTSMSQYDTDNVPMSKSPSIVEIAKAAGFEVSWISNHAFYGVTSKPHSVIASAADNQVWINQYSNDAEFKTEYYDEELIEPFEKVLASDNKKKIIFLHLFGNHASYSHRYPKNYMRWSEDDDSGSYDNSVLYDDEVVKRIYDIAISQKDLQAIMFFSDHGEQMGLGHNPDAFTYSMARIPFWISLSNSYIKDYPEVASAISHNINKPFTNDLVFNILCGLTGITEHHFYKSDYDITSKDFNIKPEDLFIFNKYKVSDDPGYNN